MSDGAWPIFRCDEHGRSIEPHDGIRALPGPPPWRHYASAPSHEPQREADTQSPPPHIFERTEVDLINAAIFLRRPLLVTGPPGLGKSSIAKCIAHQLRLGRLLRWPINTRSTIREGLYHYDALARLHDGDISRNNQHSQVNDIGRYLRLGPLGTALLPRRIPRVLLIDEIDKSDVDLPNDLLDTFEEGVFEIPELFRLAEHLPTVLIRPCDDGDHWPISGGVVRCSAFPIVILTSNGERSFPAPFLRRCIRLEVEPPDDEKLSLIVEEHLKVRAPDLVSEFLRRREVGHLATDQLLNAVFLVSGCSSVCTEDVRNALFRSLED